MNCKEQSFRRRLIILNGSRCYGKYEKGGEKVAKKCKKKYKVQKLNIFVWIRMQFVLLNFSHKCGLGKPLKSHFLRVFRALLGPRLPQTLLMMCTIVLFLETYKWIFL